MATRELVPGARNRPVLAARFGEDGVPFFALHRDMNRILDDFARGFGLAPQNQAGGAAGWPHVEVSETDDELKVVADLPGMEEKDVDVSLHDGLLTLKGEKKTENSGALYSERWHGQFQRSLQLGPDVDPDKTSASFKNGVLTVTLAKRPDARSQTKRIPITN